MEWTKEERGGKALCSWQVSSLVVDGCSSLSHSPGKGRGKLQHQSHVPGYTASPGHQSEKHLPFSFSALQALHDSSAECFDSYQRQNQRRHQNFLYNFVFLDLITACFYKALEGHFL